MRLPRSSLRRRPLVALIILIMLLVIGYVARAADSGHSTGRPAGSSSVTVRSPGATARGVPLTSLPPQVGQTLLKLRSGARMPYSQDGVVYRNLERQLPARPGGYYHEYTVVTPGSPDRGARRLITGTGGELYYTADHYHSFVAVDDTR